VLSQIRKHVRHMDYVSKGTTAIVESLVDCDCIPVMVDDNDVSWDLIDVEPYRSKKRQCDLRATYSCR
jgi:hypothetical protein